MLLLILQRYEFSSKSQQLQTLTLVSIRCCWYYKGTNFQANHNGNTKHRMDAEVVADTTKVRIFKQITTPLHLMTLSTGCCWYYKGTNFQANHNKNTGTKMTLVVVADTTKVRIFKQITTKLAQTLLMPVLLLILQRYEFSSKSQQSAASNAASTCCCWYYKGTNFQANHNSQGYYDSQFAVVADTTKVRIFKQITTTYNLFITCEQLLLILQRYEFSSKSQHLYSSPNVSISCCWYYKGTNFQANHNPAGANSQGYYVVADTTKVRIFKQITTFQADRFGFLMLLLILQRYEFSSKSQHSFHALIYFQVVADTTKVRIFKQITTKCVENNQTLLLLLILQRYEFSSKSQLLLTSQLLTQSCCWYYKGTNFQANHNWSTA